MKKKLLIFVVAYNAENLIQKTLDRIPDNLDDKFEVEILVSDDCSNDNTLFNAKETKKKGNFKYTFIRTSENLGYGGNQKLGYTYAIKNNFDLVALLHGDGQYAPESLNILLSEFDRDKKTSLVLGSRMMNKFSALKGRMPLYKFLGNIILSKVQNLLLSSNLSEFHTGYRIFDVKSLSKINFYLNTNNFHFDTEIIIQLFANKFIIKEVPISTFYGDEACHVNGFKYALNVCKASIKYKLMKLGIFYDPKYYSYQKIGEILYEDKLKFESTHSLAFNAITAKSNVIDLGCADGYLSKKLTDKKNCKVFSYDFENSNYLNLQNFQNIDLNKELPDIDYQNIDYIVLLDVIEHLYNPERFLKNLNEKINTNKKIKILASTGNVCFFITRFMMFLGQFNYGPRGILDITHTRLFTFSSFRRLFENQSYSIHRKIGVPAPYPLAIKNNLLSKILLNINKFLIRFSKGLFSYQIFYEIKPKLDIKTEYKNIFDN